MIWCKLFGHKYGAMGSILDKRVLCCPRCGDILGEWGREKQ